MGRTLIINTPGLTRFQYQGGKPTNGSFIFTLFSKGDQIEVKLANLKFSKIGDGHQFLVFGRGLVIGDYRTSPSLMGKLTVNGPFSIAMLNYQKVNHKSNLLFCFVNTDPTPTFCCFPPRLPQLRGQYTGWHAWSLSPVFQGHLWGCPISIIS